MPRHPDRELMTIQSMVIKVHVGESVNFVGVTYKNMGEELLIGAEITQRQLCHQSPVNVSDSPRNQGPLERTEQPLGISVGWRVFFPSLSIHLDTAGKFCED